jgi:hypothetical protein
LPTIQEFCLFYEELYKNGKGNFSDAPYWTSTTENGYWYYNFNRGVAYN